MTEPTFDGEITSPGDFEAALQQLLVTSLQNGIDPRGSWVCRDNGAPMDVEVMVTELEPRERLD